MKEPSTKSMPSGFELQAIQDQQNRIVLYYDDQTICPFSQKDVMKLMANDTIAVAVSEESSSSSPDQFQTDYLNSFKSKPGISDRVQAVDINGYKGVGYYVTDAVDQYGNPIEIGGQTAGVLMFYHERDNTVYAIYANQPLEKLMDIAKTIPQE